MEQKIYQRLADIVPVTTVHDTGQKFVFLKNGETETALTQFAYGKFMPGEKCEEHLHPTMEECFYFTKGTGIYTVGGTVYPLAPGVFLRIPAGMLHQLEATGDEPLEFVYLGVAITV